MMLCTKGQFMVLITRAGTVIGNHDHIWPGEVDAAHLQDFSWVANTIE